MGARHWHATYDVIANVLGVHYLGSRFNERERFRAAAPLTFHVPEDGQLCRHCLSTASRSSKENIGVSVVQSMEYLSLDRIEVLESEQLLVGGVLEGGDRKWLEVEQFGVRWVELRQNKVLEGDGDS